MEAKVGGSFFCEFEVVGGWTEHEGQGWKVDVRLPHVRYGVLGGVRSNGRVIFTAVVRLTMMTSSSFQTL